MSVPVKLPLSNGIRIFGPQTFFIIFLLRAALVFGRDNFLASHRAMGQKGDDRQSRWPSVHDKISTQSGVYYVFLEKGKGTLGHIFPSGAVVSYRAANHAQKGHDGFTFSMKPSNQRHEDEVRTNLELQSRLSIISDMAHQMGSCRPSLTWP